MSVLLVVASNTGNTLTFVDFIKKHLKEEIILCTDFSKPIENYEKIIFGTYTWGDGKIPKRMKDYLIENHRSLRNKKIFVYGSGNSIYPKFCGAVDGILKICSDCESNIIGSFKFEQRFIENSLLESEKDILIKQLEEF